MSKFKSQKLILTTLGIVIFFAAAAAVVYALTVTDTFSDETKIGAGTTKVAIAGGQAKLAECYLPSPSWTKIADTIVRDISSLSSSATVAKDIYCDDNNCVLWTDGAAAPTTACIATDSNVYGNLLWSKTDDSTGSTWSDSNFSISSGDIGGTHPSSLTIGNGSADASSKNWLNNYYTNTPGMFNAMDTCKAKGSGWRLPNILELDSIRYQAKGSSPVTGLPNIVAASYWSSSEYSSTYPYYMIFSNGIVNVSNKSNAYYVRCVRPF